MVFTVYGLCWRRCGVGIWLWLKLSPPKSHDDRVYLWIVMHALFMAFGLGMKSLDAVILWYSWAGLSIVYLFIYDDAGASHPSRHLAAATGWFWAMYSVGIGVIGSYLRQFFNPNDG